ncbi:MAG: C1 family peptidase [Pirellulales bacterium]
MASFVPSGLGWQRDLPDARDHLPTDVAELLAPLKPLGERPSQADWREYLPAVDDQRDLPAGAAHACLGMLQYFERRATGAVIEPSRLFIHVTSLRIAYPGEGCASLRTTWKAISRFGAVPEAHFPYEPTAIGADRCEFAYAFAREFGTLNYVRLDDREPAGDETLETVRDWLAAGFAVAFGFPVYTSITTSEEIAFPTRLDGLRGGQVVMAVGYDDKRRIRSDKGAILIRNSWGPAWGDSGYGWLPYSYVRRALAGDFWTILKPEWITADDFAHPPIG